MNGSRSASRWDPARPERGETGGLLGRLVACSLDRTLRSLSRRVSFVESEVAAVATGLGPGDVCFDVGAGFGLYTYVLAQWVGPEGQVHSLEPLPVPRWVLDLGVRCAGLSQVRVHAAAAGRRPGTAAMSLPHRNGTPVHGRAFLTTGARGRASNREFPRHERLTVRVTTLDQVCSRFDVERVDFIKMDVEGAEPAVLDGASETLARDRPDLLLEVEDRHLARYGARADDLFGRLGELGYVGRVWRRGRWDEVDTVAPGHRNYLFSTSPAAVPPMSTSRRRRRTA